MIYHDKSLWIQPSMLCKATRTPGAGFHEGLEIDDVVLVDAGTPAFIALLNSFYHAALGDLTNKNKLVGGWATPLKNMSSSLAWDDDYSQQKWENNKNMFQPNHHQAVKNDCFMGIAWNHHGTIMEENHGWNIGTSSMEHMGWKRWVDNHGSIDSTLVKVYTACEYS